MIEVGVERFHVMSILFGQIAGLLTAALFGLSNIVYKSQSEEIRPLAITALKMWISLPLMAVLVLISVGPIVLLVPLVTVFLLALSIIPGAIIGDMVYFYSQERIGVSRAFPIAMIFPLVTYFLDISFLNAPFLANRLFGIVLVVLGISIIVRGQASKSSGIKPRQSMDKMGVILAFVAAFLWAIASIFAKIALIDVDVISANFIRILAGSIALLPMFLISMKQGMPLPTRKATKLVLVAGLFGMGFGSLGYVTAVMFTGATISSVLSSTAPLFAIPASAYFLKEKITLGVIIGTLASVIGVWLVIL